MADDGSVVNATRTSRVALVISAVDAVPIHHGLDAHRCAGIMVSRKVAEFRQFLVARASAPHQGRDGAIASLLVVSDRCGKRDIKCGRVVRGALHWLRGTCDGAVARGTRTHTEK